MSAARWAATVLAALLTLIADGAHAGMPRLCEQGVELSAQQKDRRLQLVAQLKHELQRSGQAVALVARSGVDLARFDLRYSHAGIALRDSPNTPWSVRQLYYACDEQRPRLFDQGLAGFLLAADDLPSAHVTLLLPPPEAAQALAAAALDGALALSLLAADYSANAFAFSTRYQNCNQWVAELLAAAWGGLGPQPTRGQAQAWLQVEGYAPYRFEGRPLLYQLARLVPLVHHDDHPEDDQAAAVFRVSMPDSLQAFVAQRWPQTQRIELCHDERRLVVRRGWQPLGPGCEPAPGDEVQAFDAND